MSDRFDRPPGADGVAVSLVVPRELRDRLEAWRLAQADRPALPDALLRLAEMGLAAVRTDNALPVEDLNASNDE